MLKIQELFLMVIMSLAIFSCTKPSIDPLVSDEKYDLAISNFFNSKKTEIFFENLFDIRQRTLVCILIPYQDQLEGEFQEIKIINQKLRSSKFHGDEGYWAIAWMDNQNLKLVIVEQRKMRLAIPVAAVSSSTSLCSYAKDIWMQKINNTQISIKFKEN